MSAESNQGSTIDNLLKVGIGVGRCADRDSHLRGTVAAPHQKLFFVELFTMVADLKLSELRHHLRAFVVLSLHYIKQVTILQRVLSVSAFEDMPEPSNLP